MKTELENLLNSGREKLTALQAEQAKKDSEDKALQAERGQRVMSALMALVPAELHEYMRADYPYSSINILIPGAAMVSASVRFEYIWEKNIQYVSSAYLERSGDETAWRLSSYEAWEGEISWVPANEAYADLDVAIARAVELGDGKADAEAEAESQREEFASNDEEPTDEGFEICPLMSTSAVARPCLLHECAWFMKGEKACSLKVLAHGVVYELEVK